MYAAHLQNQLATITNAIDAAWANIQGIEAELAETPVNDIERLTFLANAREVCERRFNLQRARYSELESLILCIGAC